MFGLFRHVASFFDRIQMDHHAILDHHRRLSHAAAAADLVRHPPFGDGCEKVSSSSIDLLRISVK